MALYYHELGVIKAILPHVCITFHVRRLVKNTNSKAEENV